jgi:hypothetical protein
MTGIVHVTEAIPEPACFAGPDPAAVRKAVPVGQRLSRRATTVAISKVA